MNTTELIQDAKRYTPDVVMDFPEEAAALIAKFAELLAKRNAQPVATADYIAYLYRDSNGTLKLAQESPPPDKAFPVFTTKISFLDVARVVLDDNVDLILKHGGVKLWEALVNSVNASYTSPQQTNALETLLYLQKHELWANSHAKEVINSAIRNLNLQTESKGDSTS